MEDRGSCSSYDDQDHGARGRRETVTHREPSWSAHLALSSLPTRSVRRWDVDAWVREPPLCAVRRNGCA